MASGKRVIIWFRNDLRLMDNPTVHHAAQLIQQKKADEASHFNIENQSHSTLTSKCQSRHVFAHSWHSLHYTI
jgi:deoxyribodipyrimidine photolyase